MNKYRAATGDSAHLDPTRLDCTSSAVNISIGKSRFRIHHTHSRLCDLFADTVLAC